jgi:prepilin-type N-terminal cleavage/methylation domain-containing protein
MGHTGRSGGASRRSRGFTLVEIVIATTILVVAVLGTFLSQLKAHSLVSSSRETSVAMADVRAVMERLALMPLQEIPVGTSTYAAGEPVAAFEGLHLRDERVVVTYPGYGGGTFVPDPLPILVTITWTGGRGERRELRVRSMRTR